MAGLAGVDGCRGGWFVVFVDRDSVDLRDAEHHVCQRFHEVLQLDAAIVCVDIPIGLLDTYSPGGRACDVRARAMLPRKRKPSVFPTPTRPQCGLEFEAARALGPTTRQSCAISRKIHEVDELLTPDLQARVFEVHPEVSFAAMRGAPLINGKKKREGRAERLATLVEHHPELAGRLDSKSVPARAAFDDVLDAYAALHTARRIAAGRAQRVPERPPVDGRGLRMEIWY